MRTEQSFPAPTPGVDTDPNSIVCRWDSPDAKQRVVLSPSLIFQLRQAAIEAFLSLPRRGIEIGGLLLGRVREEGGTSIFEVAAPEDVPCEHRFGPSYVLDDPDRMQLAQLLARRQRSGSPPVIGFYRSYTGREARLDDSDQELIRSCWPERNLVCLLLQPLSMQKCAAGFRFWNHGELLLLPAYVPFPFEVEQMKQEALNPEPPPSVGPVVAPAVEPEQPLVSRPAYRRAERRDEHEDEETGSARRFGILLPLLCFVLLAIAAAAGYQLRRVSREPRFAEVHLDAKFSGKEWLLNWDPAATAVAHATRGILTVNDGPAPQAFSLTPAELHGGRFGYTASNSDVLFQLHLYDHDKPVAEDSLRVVEASIPPVKPSPTSSTLRALYQVNPVISPAVRARIEQPISVNVMATVDRSGHVIRAWPKIKSRGFERYLADAAVRAARLWTFPPSRTVTTITIPFEFRPE